MSNYPYAPDKNTAKASPAMVVFDITPNDSTDLATTAKSLYVKTAGDLRFTAEGMAAGTSVTWPVAATSILPVRVTRVWDTDTTATVGGFAD